MALSDCGVQVYEAKLQLRLHMSGYANVMHTWYFASAAVGIGALMLVQLVGASVDNIRPEAAAIALQRAPP